MPKSLVYLNIGKSIINRCCKNVYDGYIKNNYSTQQPTLKDFREELLKQKETEAHDLALAIELFTDGSLNTFAQPTNVDINNRLISYDILELGDSLLPVGMLIVLDNLLRRISRATNNRYKFRTATETAITGSRYNDTPAQSQVERDKTVATNESSSDELGEVKLLWSLLATDRLMISF